MTDWKSCRTPPQRTGLYEVQRRHGNGEPFDLPEVMRFNGVEFINRYGTPVALTDEWREIGEER